MKSFKVLKLTLLLLIDIILVNISYIIASSFSFTLDNLKNQLPAYIGNALIITAIYVICFYLFNFYKSLWSYASIDEFLTSIGGCIIAGILAVMYEMISNAKLHYSIGILGGLLSIILVLGFRLSFRIYRRMIFTLMCKRDKSEFKRVMIIGAGSAGQIMAKEMKHHLEMKYLPVAFIDDDKNKIGTVILGVTVFGDRHKIKEIAKERNIDEIIIAIPSLGSHERKILIDKCKETACKTKTIPGLYEIIKGNMTLSQIRDVDVEDLLGRETVKLENEGIFHYLEGNTVLVTGGGGSIGSELCRQIAKFKPKQLLMLDIYENNAYDLQNELKLSYPDLNLNIIIASIRDVRRLERIFEEHNPKVVFHAAAHKHVPLMESNPTEALKNNVFGTLNVAKCADKFGVKRFVLISTDKAVNPTNIMGASKRICEMIIQAMDKQSNTEFVAVRFGNVLGSNGSVIPLFKKQIVNGGPITVTHEDITRFFMTIPEAAQLVLQAGAYAEGGEIFILDMGKPVRIYDLACDLIKLSGLEPYEDIKVEITGLRPGEKLYEELLMTEEGLSGTRHEKIFIGRPAFNDMDVLERRLGELYLAIDNESDEEVIKKVKELVPTYKNVAIN